MPSLRRTASSPSVRSAPYSNGVLAARGHGHRRSSGSETTSRRVLADIEWWRVTDGQCDPGSDQESEDPNRGIQDLLPMALLLGSGIPVTHVDEGVEHLSPFPMPRNSSSTEGSSETALPTEQFSGLSITPYTPTRRHHTFESSPSSLESTPQAADIPLESLSLGLSDMGVGFFDASLLPLSQRHDENRFSTLSPMLKRSFTIAECLSLKDDDNFGGGYADFAVSPLSSSPIFLN